MKLLFDQNLSRKLPTRIVDVFPNASHVQFHNLTEANDSKIWEFAKANNFCIVTQDVDFAERSRLYGSPPKVSCCAFNLYKWNRQDACSTRVQNIRIIQFSCVTA